MHITFVRPNIFDLRTFGAMEVLSFAILKSLTPPDVETAFYDERFGPIPLDGPTDLVALTVETFTARRAYQIAAEFRRRGVKVVMGGFHPTFMPDEALRFADAVVCGDAEGVWPHVVSDARAGRLRRLYRQEEFPEFGTIRPDHGIFRGMPYVPMTLVQYSRGCRFNCDFCSIRAFYGSSLRRRPVRDVVEEIEQLGRKHLLFVDDNLFVDVPRTRELFEALIPLNVRWSCQISIDVARDPQLVRLMQRSGCLTALIGFESLNRTNLRQMNKGWNVKWNSYETSIERLHDAGIMIYGTFVFGYDDDTPDVFDRTVEFAIRNRFSLGGFNPLMPTPGTRLYDELQREGRMIHDRWWIDPDYRYGEATFRPRRMTAEQFTEGCFRARRTFSTYSSVFRRLLDRRTNLGSPYRTWVYLYANYLLRREIHAKQGKALGAQGVREPLLEPVSPMSAAARQ